MRRFLLLSVLFVAATLLACDEDPIAPPTTGGLSLKFVRSDNSTSPPGLQQTTAAEPTGQVTTNSDAPPANKTPLQGAGTVDLLPRVGAFVPDPQSVEGGSSTEAAAATAEPQQTPASDVGARAPAEVSAIEVATIRINGPSPRVLENQAPGSAVTVEGLDPGPYTVIFEGLVGGEIDYYGTASVTVAVGENRTATLNYGSFRPTMTPFSSPTTNMTFPVSFTQAFSAESYLFELDTDPSFSAPIFETVMTETSISIWVTDPGTYYARATANNADAGYGRPGDAEAIVIRTDQDASGDNRVGAAPLGFSPNLTLSELNIAPPGDEDWFAVDACLGDVLMIDAAAQRLDPISELDTYIDLFNATQPDSIAFNDDANGLDSYLEATLPSGGRYYIRVRGPWIDAPAGHYDLTVSVTRGPVNNGSSCDLPTGVTNGWTGAGDGISWSGPGNWFNGVPIATDTVAIPGTATPVLTENVTVAGLVIAPGGHVDTDVYDLTVTGDLSAGFSITGSGTVIMTGSGVSLSGGVPNLLVTGDVSLAGRAFAIGNVDVQGALRLNGYQMAVDGMFSTTSGSGVLDMQTDADTLAVAGLAAFAGGETTGLLTAGRLILAGGIRAQTVAATFAPSGTHRVVMAGAGDRTITDVVGVSFFNDLALQTTGTVSVAGVAGQAQINNQLISDASITPIVTGGNLLAYGVAVQNMVLNNATLLISNGVISALDGVIFQNFPAGTQQLIINHPGGSYTFNNLQFSQDNGAADAYIEARDAITGDNDTLKVTLAGASPLDGLPGGTFEYDGALVNWVVAQAGPPSQVSFTVQPSNGAAGTAISPAVQVTIQDAATITVDTSTATVSLAINNNPAGGTLSGTSTIAAVSGVATFNDLSIDKAGIGYTLLAFSPGLTGESSSPFAVSAGTPTAIALESGNNQTASPGTILPDSLGVLVIDALGNGVSGVDITWTATVGGGSVTATSTTDAAGIAWAEWTLGSGLGTNTVEATPSTLTLTGSPVEFTANAANAVSWLNAISGNWSNGANWSGGSPPTATDAALISADGNYTVTVDADVSVESITLGGAANGPTVDANGWTITATGTVRVNQGSVFNLTSSTLNAVTVVNEGSLEPTGSTINADVDNRSQVVARGSTTFNGTFTQASVLLLDGAGADVTFTSGFTNTGLIEFASAMAGGYPSMYVNTGTLVNAVGGKIRFSGLGGGYLEAVLDNRDSLKVESAETVSLLGATIANSGVMYAATSELDVDGAFTNSGIVNIGDNLTFGSYGAGFTNAPGGQIVMGLNATLDLSNTTTVLAGGYTVRDTRSIWIDGSGEIGPSVSVAGILAVAPGGSIGVLSNTVAVDSLINSGDVTLDVAHIVGPVNNLGTFNATVGGNSVTGTFYNATNGWTEVSEPGAELVIAGDLTNAIDGTVKLYSTAAGTAPRLQVTGGTMTHHGWFDSDGPAGGLVVVDSLDNQGELHAMSGGTFTVQGGAVYNRGTFVLSAADMAVTGGGHLLNAGTISLSPLQTFTRTGGTFENAVDIVNDGTVDVSGTTFTTSGVINPDFTVNFVGDVTMTGGAINIDINGATPGTEYDAVNVSGAVVLSGELGLIPNYTPTAADTFQIMTFGSRTGIFSSVSGQDIGGGLALSPRYTDTDLKLVVTAGPDSVVVGPTSAALIGAGAFQQFGATAFSGGQPLVGVTYTWSSLNTNVATVDADGLVTAVASGQTTIVASSDGVNGYALVTVTITDPAQVTVWGGIPVAGRTWGVSPDDIWTCSSANEISRYNGTSWTPYSTPVDPFTCRGIWGTTMDDVIAVGFGGVTLHFNGTAWEELTNPTTSDLLAIWGSSPTNVFAVGGTGTIIHFDGTSWVALNSGATENLRGVWGSGADDVYITGNTGVLLHSTDGINWAPVAGVPTTTEALRNIWGASSTDIYLVGTAGTVWHYNGSSWGTQSSPIADNLMGLTGSSASDLYAVAQTGRIMRYDGGTWTEVIPGLTGNSLFAAWAAPGGDLYASGFRGFRGATVSATAATTTLTAIGDTVTVIADAFEAGGSRITGTLFVWSSDNEAVATVDQMGIVTAESEGIANIWATATGGARGVRPITVQQQVASVTVSPPGASITGGTQAFTVTALDGNGNPIPSPSVTWSSLNTGVATIDGVGTATAVTSGQTSIEATVGAVTGYALLTVASPAASPVNLWGSVVSGTTEQLFGTWGTAETNVYSVGGAGTILHFDGTAWSPMSSGTAVGLYGVWGTSSADVFAVGDGGTILHYDGSSWSPMTSGTNETLYGVWGAAPTEVIAVGGTGTLLRYDGTTWSPATSGTDSLLFSAWGTSTSNAYVVGYNGIIRHYDGSVWTPVTTNSASRYHGIWGTSASDIYVPAYDSSRVLHYDGNSWSVVATSIPAPWKVWGTSSSEVYTFGASLAHFDGGSWNVILSQSQITSLTGGASNHIYNMWGTSNSDVHGVGNGGAIVRGYRNATVTLTGPTSNLVGAGDQVQLTAEGQDAGGGPIDMSTVSVSWASDDDLVATVDANGLVTAVGQGVANISATSLAGASGSAPITVQIPAQVVVSPTGATLASSGATQQYSAQVLDEDSQVINPAEAPVTWSSLNTGFASAESGTGLVTAARAGQAVISADAAGLSGYAIATVAFAGSQPVSVWDTVTISPTTSWLWSAWGRSPSEVYATGTGGVVREWNGSSWLDQSPATTQSIRDIWGATSTDLWSVGNAGEILQFDGASWTDTTTVTPAVTSEFLGIWGAAPNDIHAVGGSGVLAHYDGTSWTQLTNPAGTPNMWGAWGVSSDTVYAVGSSCTILRYNGTSWSQITSGTCTNTLYRAWGPTATNMYITGTAGLLLHYDGTNIDTIPTGVTNSLYGVWGTGPTEIFAASSSGMIWAYDGSTWSQMPSGASSVHDIWGSSSGDFFGGWGGGVLRGYRGLPASNFGEDVEQPAQAGWTPNFLIATPITVSSQTDITHLNLIMKSAGGQARLGLYSDNVGLPDQLIAETGVFALTGPGTFQEPVLQRIRVEPGTYWIAHLYDVQAPGAYNTAGGPGYYTGAVGQLFDSGFPAAYSVGTFVPNTLTNYYITGFVVP